MKPQLHDELSELAVLMLSLELLLIVPFASDSATDHWLQCALMLAWRVLRLTGEAHLPYTSASVTVDAVNRWPSAIRRWAVIVGAPIPELDKMSIGELGGLQKLAKPRYACVALLAASCDHDPP